jgi:PKHD-type hydroxylase
MLVTIPGVLSAEEVATCVTQLQTAQWSDGRESAGYLSQAVKNNAQLADTDPTARQLGDLILRRLEKNPLFFAAALPLKVLPPLFNRYAGAQEYGRHIDGAIRPIAGTPHRVRTDLSATLFLSERDSYEGGELVIHDTLGERSVKLASGDLFLYPASSVHRVTPVTRGVRLAAFFWIQSMVRDATQRSILFSLDSSIQRLAKDVPGNATLVELAGVYHNLLRAWSDS